jgi:hypothetical protein
MGVRSLLLAFTRFSCDGDGDDDDDDGLSPFVLFRNVTTASSDENGGMILTCYLLGWPL